MERVGKGLLALLIVLAVGAPHSNIAAAQGDSPFGYDTAGAVDCEKPESE